MAETIEVKELLEKLNKTHEDFKKVNDAAEVERKKFGEELAQSAEKIEKLQTQLDDTQASLKRHNTAADNADEASAEEKAYSEAYDVYLRKGEKGCTAEQNECLTKSLSADDNTDGGYWMPVEKRDELIKKLIEFSPVREFATVIPLSRGDSISWPAEDDGDFDCDWVGERGDRDETDSGKIRLETIPVHELYANPKVTQKLLDDVPMVDGWISERIARRFAVKEGTAFVSGNGVTQPEGFLESTATIVTSSTGGGVLKFDDLLDVQYDLRAFYDANAMWAMERGTEREVRKLKDGEGQYLWQPNNQAGQPAMLLNKPIISMIDMPDLAASSKSIAYADWRAFYWIVDRMGIRVLRDPFSSKPFIQIYTTKRTGAQVVLPEAGRILQMKA